MQPSQERQQAVGAIQFSLNAHCGDGLRLSQRTGPKAASFSLGAPAVGAGSCKFAAHRSTAACKTILLRRRAGLRGAAAAPFASLSLASVTLAPSKGAPAAAPAKKKKSLGQVLDEAGKKALRGGLPGMAAMAVQVSPGAAATAAAWHLAGVCHNPFIIPGRCPEGGCSIWPSAEHILL